MHKRQKQFNPSGIKWPTEIDMPLNKTQTQTQDIDRTLTGSAIPGKSGPGCNGRERIPHIPLSSRTGASVSDVV